MDNNILIPRTEVRKITGLSYSEIWRLEIKNRFPKRKYLSVSTFAWNMKDVLDWVESKNN